MTALSSLWLPILLSAVLVFVASSIVHMLLPWHKSDYPKVPDEERAREGLRALAIPPAWTEVWVSPSPNGHIQATGRDARGRKQYLYHERWREVRDENKYERISSFGKALAWCHPSRSEVRAPVPLLIRHQEEVPALTPVQCAASHWAARMHAGLSRRLSVVRVLPFLCSVFPASSQVDEEGLTAHLLSEFRPTADAQLYPFLDARWWRAEQAVHQQDRIISRLRPERCEVDADRGASALVFLRFPLLARASK